MQRIAYCYSRPDYAFVYETTPVKYAPANATFTAPGPEKAGFAQVFRPKSAQDWPYSGLEKSAEGPDGDWFYIEDHRAKDKGGDGLEYWLPEEGDDWQSQPRIMHELGPLPAGAVTVRPEKPAPTEDELFSSLRAARDAKLAEYDAAVSQLRREERAGADVTDTLAVWDAYANALCALPQQPGAPWDGGKEETPWPEVPLISTKKAV